jgi:hypothetical protein
MARIELSNAGGGGGTLTLTTTGTSGASTLVGTALNIPVYQGQLTLSTAGTSGASTLVGNTLTIPTYQGQVSLTTTGTSGASTFVGNTLNVPQYQGALTLTTTGSGAATLVGTTLNIPTPVATAPGGSNTDIQYNNSGAFGGSSNLQWDNTSVRLNIRPALSSSAALSVRGGSDLSSSFSFVAGNNSGTEFFRVRNDGIVSARGNYLQLGTDVNVGIGPTTNGTSFTSSGADVLFAGSNAGSSNACATFNIFGGTKTASSGTLGITGGTFSPTTGSNTYSIINVTSGFVINQTGTATGITRGINIAPTLTAAANYRAIDWNNNTGYGLYGTGTANNYLAGDTVVGTTTPSAKLHSRGSNASSGTNAFLVQNSTPSDIYKIENNGKITYWATNTAAGTTAPQTINRPSGTVNFAAAATTLVVTNSLCTTSSIVFATVRTADATAYIKNVVPAAGSFTIELGAAATAETSVGFFIIN